MDAFKAIILGIVQGLTEFLPVSSSGHLVISQRLFGLTEPELFFDISVHMGTLFAVIIFFRKELRDILVSLWGFLGQILKREASWKQISRDPDLKITLLIIGGSIPTAFMGFFFKSRAELIFSSLLIVGLMLIVTGLLLLSTYLLRQKEGEGILGFTMPKALSIGFVQGLAILPGISRSGATISAALFLGIDRETAAKYSFLLSIPAILGAVLLGLREIETLSTSVSHILLGTATAFVAGYFSLKFLIYLIKDGRLHVFGPYCLIVGFLAVLI